MSLCGLPKWSGFMVQRQILCLCRSLNSGASSRQLSHSQHSVLLLCYRNILHDSHCRSGNWLRSGRSAATDIHRLSDCRSDSVSCNHIFWNILIAQLFNNVVSNIDVLRSLMRGNYSCIARRQESGNIQPWYIVINIIVFCWTHWEKPRNILSWDTMHRLL